MSSTNSFIALSFIAALFCGGATSAVAQQGAAQEVQIDCSAFKKDNDGSWIASHSTTLKIGTNSVTISGKTTGSVNGLSIQSAISQKCEQAASPAASPAKPAAGGSSPTYVGTNWIAKPQTQDACVARGREVVQTLPQTRVVGESVIAWSDGYTFVIRCTPRNMVFFTLVGPPDTTAERTQAAQSVQDKIIDNW